MAFNASWQLEELARELKKTIVDLLIEFQHDLAEMISTCPVFKLKVTESGNLFYLVDATGKKHAPGRLAGLYSVFTTDSIIYVGEATDLYRRQLEDPDNTADSGKTFNNQGRAILKYVLHRGWGSRLGLEPIFMQLYPGSCTLSRQAGRTFEECYRISKYSKALEGAMALFIYPCHGKMIQRARNDRLLPETG